MSTTPQDDTPREPVRVTMRDIAAKLGLHHTTVSLALRDSELLRAETKTRIREEAARLGYRPDPVLAALNVYRQSRTSAAFQSVIGWIDNWKGEPGRLLKNPTYRAYYDGACARAKELGYAVEIFRMHQRDMSPQRMQQIFRARNVGGVLVAPQERPGNYLGLDFSELSALAFGFSSQPCELNLITARHEQAIDLITENIYRQGYRRPGYCILPESDSGSNYTLISRWSYFLSTHKDVATLPRVEALDEASLARWIKKHKPDVLVGHGDLLGKIEGLGFSVPDDLGLVCVAASPGRLRATGVDQNDFLIGRRAVDVLAAMIHHNEKGLPKVPIRTFVDCTWYEGETLRQQKPARRRAGVSS